MLRVWATAPADPTNASPVHFNVSFSEPVFGVTASLFSTAGSGATVGIGAVTQLRPRVFRVSVNAGTSGSVRLAVGSTAGVADAAGNTLLASALFASINFGALCAACCSMP